MKNIPRNMIPDRDNVVYFDWEIGQFYMIEWKEEGNEDYAIRYYIEMEDIKPKPKKKKIISIYEHAHKIIRKRSGRITAKELKKLINK